MLVFVLYGDTTCRNEEEITREYEWMGMKRKKGLNDVSIQ